MHCSAKYLSLGLVLASAGLAGAQGVFISEYIEGSSNNKAVEVYNGTGADIDMADYVFLRANNGSMTGTYYGFTGTVADGDVYVIGNPTTGPNAPAPAILAASDALSQLTFYNGDDFVGLYEINGADTTLIDLVGERGFDPGTAWTVGTGATAEYTLVRMASVTSGATTWVGVGDTQWDVYPQNTFDYLGSHGAPVDSPPSISGVVLDPVTPYPADVVTISATITDGSAVSSASLSWGLVSGSLSNTITMSLDAGDTWITDSAIPAQIAGTQVFYAISATDDASQTTTTSEASYTVASAATLAPGDLVITEIMQNPNMVLDTAGEWFEIYNSTANAIDLAGLEIKDDGTNTFTVGSSVVVPAGGFVVLGLNGDTGTNGGVTLDYVYPSTWTLGNGDDEVVILDGATEIDRVNYDGGPVWPDPTGASMFLTVLGADNNVGANWATSTAVYGAGDLGTPGSGPSTAPAIANLAHTPANPLDTDLVTVTADVTDDGTLTAVNLVYTVDGGADNTVAMNVAARALYTADIPAQADGSVVAYRVEATDNDTETTVSAIQSYTVQALGCADIAADLRVQDANEIPVNMGAVVMVCGIVTAGHEFGAAGPGHIQDATGAMAIFGPTGSPFIGDATVIGDEVQVTGVLTQFSGLTEVNVTSITVLSSGNSVTPLTILGDGMNEATEAYLVSIDDVVFATPGVQTITGSGLNFNATVAGVHAIQVRVDADAVGGSGNTIILPSDPITLTGVVGQFDSSAPHNSGYQLLVRGQYDIPVGAGNLPPAIAGLDHTPGYPDDSDFVVVSATVTDSDGTISGATLHYSLNAGADNTVLMGNSGDVYSAIIPSQAAGTVVAYYVTATDDDADESTSSTGTYTVTSPLTCTQISDVAADDANGVPLLNGTVVKVCGTVTAGTVFNVNGPVYMQDATGGVCVFGGDVAGMGLQPGDQIEATGVLTHFNGLTQLATLPMVTLTGSGPAPVGTLTPASTFATPAAIEAIEGQLIRIDNVVFPTSGQVTIAGSGVTYTCTADGQSFDVRIDGDIDYVIEGVPNQFILPAGPVTLTAVVSQFDAASPFDTGYQLLPRFQADLATALDTPALTVVRTASDIHLSWGAISGATGYSIYRSNLPYTGFTLLNTTASTSYVDAGAVGGGKWFYQVVATN